MKTNKRNKAFVTGVWLSGAIQYLRDCEREFIAARSYHYNSSTHMYYGSLPYRAETVLRVHETCNKMCAASVKLADAYDAYVTAYKAAKRIDRHYESELISLMYGDK